ncbi:MAG TPA: hypothetical protein VFB03_02885 [Candidatus Saccharimonadales bacterium]|nr:hypothetical protein [Candidatus Saccharimonadales bacterium]
MNGEVGGPNNFEGLPPEPAQSPEQVAEQAPGQAVEQQRPAAAEAGAGKRVPQPGSTTDITQLMQQQAAPTALPADQTAPAGPVSSVTADLTAADADLIEKEWIERAKSIVAKTRDDPHLQKSEMSKAKADYIQKRYKKIIKTDDTVTA